MHPLLVGGNPFTTTSIYGLILYLEKKWGIHYSMGGTGNIIKGLEKLMEEIEIEIIKNTEVREIITKSNKITGVVVNNEEIIEADNGPQAHIPAPQLLTATSTVSHYLIAGRAAALTPGTTIAPGVSVAGPHRVTIASNAQAQLNGQAIDGDVTLSVGDRLMASGVEVLFISVES